jgi:hypothetical protein
MTDRTDTKKKALLAALEKNLGIVTQATKQVGIHRSTYYDWMEQDPEFAKAARDIQEVALDFVEGKLLKRIQDESDTAILFYLKTKGKHRGYIERTEVAQPEPPTINWKE